MLALQILAAAFMALGVWLAIGLAIAWRSALSLNGHSALLFVIFWPVPVAAWAGDGLAEFARAIWGAVER